MRAGSGHLELIGPTWFLRYRERTVDGRGRRRSVPRRARIGKLADLRSRTAARAAADAWLRAQRPQTLEPGPSVTAAEYFEHYLATHVVLMRVASQRRYRSTIRHHLIPRFGHMRLEEVDVRAIQAWISEAAPKHARQTLSGLRAILLQILRQALTDKFAAHRIPARSIRLPKVMRPPRERREINDRELSLLLDVSEPLWRLLWAIMGYAGLRVGEALGLEWQDVLLDQQIIRVRQNAVLGRLQPTKTETSRRDIPILPELDAEFRRYRTTQAPAARGLIFRSERGTPLRTDNVRARVLRPALARAGVRHSGLHGFRHGLPGRLAAIGASPAVIQRVMRHASLKQTEEYLHTENLDLHAALARARNASSGVPAGPSL